MTEDTAMVSVDCARLRVRPIEGGMTQPGRQAVRIRRMTAAIAVLLVAVAVAVAGCAASPTASPSPGFGPATWALDPAFPSPAANSTELHILVWERACASGSAATGRMSTPRIEYAAGTVTITVEVRGLLGIQECPGNQATPLAVQLTEAIGDRTLLDGGRDPIAAPSPP